MKVCFLSMVCIAAIMPLQARADTSHPYQLIPEQNVFKLRAPERMQTPPPTPIKLPKILLQGISTIALSKKVLFMTAAEPGQKERWYVFEEGQSRDGISVLRIDEKSRCVTFNNRGTIQELNLAKDAPKSPKPDIKPPINTLLPPPRARKDPTPEEQIILIEVERERTKNEVERGDLPALPPTELTPEGSTGISPVDQGNY
jgi:hypothetical protein